MATTAEKPIAVTPAAAEYIAQLAANLYVSTDAAPKRLALTAPDAGGGKTSLGLALAVQVGDLFSRPTLFIEGNLRRPRAARMLHLDDDQPGLAACLAGGKTVDECIVSMGDGMPAVMPAGKVADHDTIGACLKKDAVAQLFTQLGQRFAYILVETSPINVYPEAQVLVAQADGVALIVNAGVTSREAAGLAVRRIEMAGAPAPTVVLNRKKFHVPEFLYKRL